MNRDTPLEKESVAAAVADGTCVDYYIKDLKGEPSEGLTDRTGIGGNKIYVKTMFEKYC
jgi:hypothetical protein